MVEEREEIVATACNLRRRADGEFARDTVAALLVVVPVLLLLRCDWDTTGTRGLRSNTLQKPFVLVPRPGLAFRAQTTATPSRLSSITVRTRGEGHEGGRAYANIGRKRTLNDNINAPPGAEGRGTTTSTTSTTTSSSVVVVGRVRLGIGVRPVILRVRA